MFSQRPLLTAVIISIIVHLVILLQIPEFRFASRQTKPGQVEITYIENKKAAARLTGPAGAKAALKGRQEPLLKLPSIITASAPKVTPPSPLIKEELFSRKRDLGSQQEGRLFAKPALIKPDIGVIKKKITLSPPQENLNKINSPSYISYFQLTRERVKRILYQRYTYTEEGEVYLSFIVANDGSIRDVRVNEERSSSSPYLREIAIASVKEASPFPAFPKDLEYPELSFNVIVSFEVE
jgi:TonB family protein